MSDLLEHLSNPFRYGIKRHLFEILKYRFSENEESIDRLSSAIKTKKDFEDFGKLIMSVYEAGYMRSTEDHRDGLAKLGFQAILEPPQIKPEPKPIFK